MHEKLEFWRGGRATHVGSLCLLYTECVEPGELCSYGEVGAAGCLTVCCAKKDRVLERRRVVQGVHGVFHAVSLLTGGEWRALGIDQGL